ncbi:MAG: substrate-binding domain-containing protein [Symbiobacteriaceae bacterium]|nr:substrate-binding domain-containing protein [Symbiobacteriaceae bacterium]
MTNSFKTIIITLVTAFLFVACTGNAAPPVVTTPVTTPATTAPTTPTAPAFDTSRSISLTAREDGSGTKTAFMEIIGLKGKADPANIVIQTGTAGVLSEVRSNPGAIAYESLGYVTSDVKALKVNGVAATVANIKDGLYKISRPLSIVYNEDVLDDQVNAAFFAFLESSEAQKIISDKGYVSIVDNSKAYTIDGSLAGSIDVSGSTSLQPLMILLADAFEELQPKVTINVSGGGSGTGYKNADEGVSEFGMISEEFALEKAPSCTHQIVCKDGIAVIVNPVNPLDNITLEDLKTLYNEEAGASAITKWSGLIK